MRSRGWIPAATRSWLGTAALICLLSVALVAPASSAAKEAPRGFYGVVAQAPLTKQDFKRMGRGRVGTLRELMSWWGLNPYMHSLWWDDFDEVVLGAAREGIRVLPTVYGTPRWLTDLEGCLNPHRELCFGQAPRTEIGMVMWRRFLELAAERYGPGGEFWAEHPRVDPVPIRAWEIWNEQNSPNQFQPQPDPVAYARLVHEAHKAIHGVDPGASVVLGGMFTTPRVGMTAYDFLDQFYDVPRIKRKFDGIGLHPYALYSGRLSEVKRQLRSVRAVTIDGRDPRVPMWITELTWGSGDGVGSPLPINTDAAGQATRLRQALGYLTRQREKLGIALVTWYAWRDTDPPGRCLWCPYSGLFEENLQPKPAWLEFTRFTGGR